MNIDILGWFREGTNNCGDTSFKKAHHTIFRKHKLNYVTPPSICESKDMIVLGGGATISPFYLATFEELTCPKYALGVSISYLSEMDLVKDTFKHVYLRDFADVELMRKKVNYPVDFIPDLSFFYTPTGGDIIKKYGPCKKRRSLGVMLTDYVNPAIDRDAKDFSKRAHSFRVNLAEELTILHRQGFDIYFIPLSTGGYGNDIRIALDVMAWIREAPLIIYDTLSPQDCIDLIAQMDVTLCMKYHAHLFSVIAGTPFVSMGFTRKVDMFLQAHELKGYVGAQFNGNDDFDTSKLRETIETAVEKKPELSKMFIETADSYYRQLHQISDTIRKDWLRE
jgi:Polysaccharide pyruvyl transferase